MFGSSHFTPTWLKIVVYLVAFGDMTWKLSEHNFVISVGKFSNFYACKAQGNQHGIRIASLERDNGLGS